MNNDKEKLKQLEAIVKAENLSKEREHYKAAKIYLANSLDDEALKEAIRAETEAIGNENFDEAIKTYRLLGIASKVKELKKIQEGRALAYSSMG